MLATFAAGFAARVRGRAATILFAGLFAVAAVTGASAAGLDRNQIFELQFRLNQLGFNAGRLDGQAGGRTMAAVSRFADAHDTIADLSPAFLAEARAAARLVEGLKQDDGSIDFLVFTDQGTPLVFTVEKIGRIMIDGDGAEAEAAAEVEETYALPREAGVAFGVRVRVPAPPPGERLAIDQVVSAPERLADGTVRFADYVTRHALPDEKDGPHTWFWRFADAPDEASAGTWRFTLENAGDSLLTRAFQVGE